MFGRIDAKVFVTASVAKAEIVPIASAAIRLSQKMLDRGLPSNLQAAEVHRMTAVPAIVAIGMAERATDLPVLALEPPMIAGQIFHDRLLRGHPMRLATPA